jgi:hypothetical protein
LKHHGLLDYDDDFSIQLNSLLFVCCINSQKTNYRYRAREQQIIIMIIINQSVSQRKHCSITKISLLMPFKEITSFYNENHTTPINTKCISIGC